MERGKGKHKCSEEMSTRDSVSFSPFRVGIIVPRVDSQHRVVDTVQVLLRAIPSTHARDTTHSGLVVFESKFATGAGVKATATSNVTRIVRRSRDLIPLEGLQCGILSQKRRGKNETASMLAIHSRHHEGRWNWLQVTCVRRLLLIYHCALVRLFVKQWFDTNATSFRSEMTAQRVGPGKSATTSPLSATGELSTTDKLFLARVQPFMTLSIVLSSKGFSTNGADERPFVCVGAQVRPKIIGSGEALGTEVTLERGGMFLDTL